MTSKLFTVMTCYAFLFAILLISTDVLLLTSSLKRKVKNFKTGLSLNYYLHIHIVYDKDVMIERSHNLLELSFPMFLKDVYVRTFKFHEMNLL